MKQQILQILPPNVYLVLKHWNYKRTCKVQFDAVQNMRIMTTGQGYSYKPFDDTRSIFVHIPKCGGVSVCKTIFGGLAGGHTTLEEYLNIFEPKCITSYFKFTVVRNPWDRVVSAYFFLISGGMDGKDKTGFKKELENFSGFEDFVKCWVNKTNIWRLHHFRPQYHYMLDNREKIHLNFVAFLENIGDDFAYITDRIGIDCILPKSNKSRHASYMDYYNDETENIVGAVYAEDIKMLGYSFDNSNLKKQLANRRAGKIYSLRT